MPLWALEFAGYGLAAAAATGTTGVGGVGVVAAGVEKKAAVGLAKTAIGKSLAAWAGQGSKQVLAKKLFAEEGAKLVSMPARKAFLDWGFRIGSGAAKMAVGGTAMTAADTAIFNAGYNVMTGNDPLESNLSAEKQLEAAAAGVDLDPAKAQWAGIADRWVEYTSEMAGPMIGEIAYGSPLARAGGRASRRLSSASRPWQPADRSR
jgi:hypothetical protein